jgi:hypothetical protein
MNRILFTLTQISICSASGPNIVAEVDHKQESASLLSCIKETTNHYTLQKENPSDRMALSSGQIRQLCIASANSKISDQSDKKAPPLIDISDPSTTTDKYTTIVWSWWKITESVRRQNINFKHSTSISPKKMSSPKPPIVTVAPNV